ncbi:PREDICTED: uncharacterized protein LOC108618756 [Drosophila arizonae]|uniref:Uncharacterized protein LOC108618756 n=1 Tax=Drosophila arizonae TaxID=7263 RepID=A0ABM1PT32_DROAR|nr:PREDICTED: uncharacterized protein LOC108618756 [Drosophila arizonae]
MYSGKKKRYSRSEAGNSPLAVNNPHSKWNRNVPKQVQFEDSDNDFEMDDYQALGTARHYKVLDILNKTNRLGYPSEDGEIISDISDSESLEHINPPLKVMPRIRMHSQKESHRTKPSGTRQIARKIVQCLVEYPPIKPKAKILRRVPLKCEKHFKKLNKLIARGCKPPKVLLNPAPVFTYMNDHIVELFGILSLLFITALLLLSYMYCKPRKLSFFDRLLRLIIYYIYNNSCYDRSYF